jgi:hypothetical protein
MPIWLALAWQARQCLPTRLRFTGAASGAVAVGFAIPLFSLGCAENAPSYIVLWFGLAIAIAIAIGALCTPRLIRW